MRQISVSIEVFAQLWATRQAGEQDENAILERILGERQAQLIIREPMEISNHSVEEKEANMPVTMPESQVLANLARLVDSASSSSGELSAHASWWEVVYAAIDRLGGEAQLHYIYKEVRQICRSLEKRMPKELDATVRGTLEDNCAESHRYKSVRDAFAMTKGRGQGTWGIKRL